MTKGRFADEFKEEAVKQVIDRGYAVGDVAKRLGVSVQSLYKWTKVYAPNATDRYEAELKEVRRENLKLKAELSRTQEERDILKKQPRTSRKTRSEVRRYLTAAGPVFGTANVSSAGGLAQWVLRVVGATPVPAVHRRRSVVGLDPRVA
jgi:transposase